MRRTRRAAPTRPPLRAARCQEATQTQKQTTVVQQLRADVAAGRASRRELEREESRLSSMQSALSRTTSELSGVFAAARGFLSSVTGGGSQQGVAAHAAAEAGSEPPEVAAERAAAGGSSARGRSPRADWPLPQKAGPAQEPAAAAAEAAAEEEPKPGTTAAAPGPEEKGATAGGAVLGLASGLVYSGLKGLANLVVAAGEAADRTAAAVEEERRASAALVGALQALRPPLTPRSSWEDARARLPAGEAAAWAALSPARCRQVFDALLLALRRAEREAEAAAAAGFRALLAEAGVGEGADWADFAASHADDARLRALRSEADRLREFESFVSTARTAREAQEVRAARVAEREARAAAAEAGFRALLTERGAALAAASDWPAAKRLLWGDSRYDAVPFRRREELWAQSRAELAAKGRLPAVPAPAASAAQRLAEAEAEAGAEAAAVAAAAAAAQAEAAADAPVPADASRSLEELQYLRAEQERLRAEYDRMAEKVRWGGGRGVGRGWRMQVASPGGGG